MNRKWSEQGFEPGWVVQLKFVDDDKLKKEIDRSKAMNGIAHTIVDNARVVLAANKFMDTREDTNLKLPRMIGVKEEK